MFLSFSLESAPLVPVCRDKAAWGGVRKRHGHQALVSVT